MRAFALHPPVAVSSLARVKAPPAYTTQHLCGYTEHVARHSTNAGYSILQHPVGSFNGRRADHTICESRFQEGHARGLLQLPHRKAKDCIELDSSTLGPRIWPCTKMQAHQSASQSLWRLRCCPKMVPPGCRAHSCCFALRARCRVHRVLWPRR